MVLNLVLLVVGFILLVKGADFFVEGSSSVAKILRVPGVIIGLTIVAMGTSFPECAVSVTAAINHSNEIAVSNVIGSNIFNLMIVIGVCAAIKAINVKKSLLKAEFPFSILVGVLLLFLCGEGVILAKKSNTLGHLDGILMLVLFAAFLGYMIYSAKKNRVEEEPEGKIYKPLICVVFIIGGAIAIVLGGNLVVASAKEIARFFGLTETLIGLTVVAFGTSLPELVTSIVAAKKGEVDMALGNVIGSNIFNILLVLGISSTITPITVSVEALIDLVILTVFSLLVYVFAYTKKKVNRPEGIIMIALYIGYTVYICLR